jgi:hypothetical protein
VESFGPWAAQPLATLPASLIKAAVAVRPLHEAGDEPVAVVLLLEIDTIGLEAA